jgi:hypothetical protein
MATPDNPYQRQRAAYRRRLAEGKRRSPTGQVIETYKPDTLGGLAYQGLGNLASRAARLLGASPEPDLYELQRRYGSGDLNDIRGAR